MRRLVLFFLSVLLIVGCGAPDKSALVETQHVRIKKAGRDRALEDSAVSVCGQTVTCGELMERLAERLRPVAKNSDLEQFKQHAMPLVRQAMADKISYVLLYERAKAKYGEKLDEGLDKGADEEVRTFVRRFGGDYRAAEEAIKERGMDWDGFRQLQKRLILVSMEMPNAKALSYDDLIDCYERMKDESFVIEVKITIRLIDIEPAKIETDPNDPNRSSVEIARELAENLLKRIRAGDDFAELAKAHSHGHRRQFGGLWKTRRPESLARPYDILADAAEKMQPGEVVGPLETGSSEHILIMKLEDKQVKGYKPLSEVQSEVQKQAIYERRQKAAEGLESRLSRQAEIAQTDEFVDLCLERTYFLYRQQ